MEQNREDRPESESPRLVVGGFSESQDPAESEATSRPLTVGTPEPEVESEVEDAPAPIRPPTPEEIKDNVIELKERGKEVLMGPAWEAIRTYGVSIRDGANAILDGIVGKRTK